MANHSSACLATQKLCDQLFEGLCEKIGHLVCSHGPNKCSIRGKGTIFAWVNSHSSRAGRLNIWFRGDAKAAARFASLEVVPRGNPVNAGGWGGWGGHFNIENEKQLLEAMDLLLEISYPASI